MGILDKNERIVDMVLTSEGRRLYSLGKLEFKHFCLFDDEVDYDPYVPSSSSLSSNGLAEARDRLLEDSFVFEAISGVSAENLRDRDNTGLPRTRLFDMPQGSDILPRMAYSPDVLSGSMEVRQAVVASDGPSQLPVSVVRQSPTVFLLELDVVDGFVDARDSGAIVRVFASGSDGLQEIVPVRDYSGDLCYGLIMKAVVDEDDETVRRKVDWYEGGVKI